MNQEIDERRLLSLLSGVDWNFPAVSTRMTSVHSLHWYPGNFIPQIPAYAVHLLAKPNDLVVDPFCGSGTTGIEAALLGRNSWQSDRSRISAMLTWAKIALLTDESIRTEFPSLVNSLKWQFINGSEKAGRNGEGADPELESWFHPDTLGQLRGIWSTIDDVRNAGIRGVLEMLFSDTLFTCASSGKTKKAGGGKRRHHWGWIADNVRPSGFIWHDARRIFFEGLLRTLHVLNATPLVANVTMEFCHADSRALPLPDASADLVLTSPPYNGMIDYANANRLTYLWFGWSLEQDRSSEIGARCRRDRLTCTQEYLEAMEDSFGELTRVMRPGGFCAMVLGASRKFPGLAEDVVRLLSVDLRLLWGPTARTPSRRRVSGRTGSAPTEFVCVYRKEK